MADEELQDWQDLIDSPGWTRFADHVAAEWGRDDGNGAAFRQAVRKVADQSDATAMAQFRQVLAAQAAVQKILRLPDEQIAQLKRARRNEDEMSVGELMAASRRGAL